MGRKKVNLCFNQAKFVKIQTKWHISFLLNMDEHEHGTTWSNNAATKTHTRSFSCQESVPLQEGQCCLQDAPSLLLTWVYQSLWLWKVGGAKVGLVDCVSPRKHDTPRNTSVCVLTSSNAHASFLCCRVTFNGTSGKKMALGVACSPVKPACMGHFRLLWGLF